MFEVNDNSGDVLGLRIQKSARSGSQQMTMSRHQSAGVCRNRSSCRIRSSRSKHRKVAWDTGEDAALHCPGFDTSPKSTSESAGTRNKSLQCNREVLR